MPLIRHSEFAERERALLFAYFSSFFPHFWLIDILTFKHFNYICQIANVRSEAKVCKKNDRLNWTLKQPFFAM